MLEHNTSASGVCHSEATASAEFGGRILAFPPLLGLTRGRRLPNFRATLTTSKPRAGGASRGAKPMKVRNSLKSLRGRHRMNRLVRRKGRLYVINKTQRRFKARQG